MRYCPTCATAYPNKTSGTCPKDGSVLVTPAQFEAQQRDPLMGTLMGGRYHIVGRVGTGGMGTVYRAEQRGLGRPVALKVLKSELVSDRETVGRFQREAKAMSLLVHPNTVRVFDFGEDPAGHLYLAMELLEGELLTAKLDREGQLDVREAVHVTQQILRSLHEAHAKGLVHRDLKPDNIYLARVEGHLEPVVKVLDFGIAKIFRDDAKPIDQLETQAGTVFGTPRYMSPEQAQGKALDPRSDLYSVGVLLFQLLVGHAPFTDEDAVVVMAKHIREEVPPVGKVVPERPIPPSLEAVVRKALEKDPARRFPSAEAFEQALAACLPDIERERALRLQGRKSSPLGVMHDRRYVPHAIAGAVAVLVVVGGTAVALLPPGGPPRGVVLEPLAGTTTGTSTGMGTVPSVPTTPTPVTTVVRARNVEVRSDPPNAEVWQNGRLIGVAPVTFSVTDSPQPPVELRLEGYVAATLDLTSTSTPEVVLPLVPIASGDPGARPQRVRPRREDDDATTRTVTPDPATTMATGTGQTYERFE
jgi:serine/threonine-protein kinase